MNPWSRRAGLVAVALATGLLATPAFTVDLSGQTVTYYMPGSAGSGLDVYARTLSPLLEKHLPGNPTVLVRAIPGAGTIAGLNTFEQQGRPDGLHVAGVSISGVMNYAIRDSNVTYDLQDWIPFLMSPQGTVVYAQGSLGIDGPEDLASLQGQRLVYGGNSPTSGDMPVVFMLDLLGLDIQRVWGIQRGPARLAFERGEFTINYDPVSAYVVGAAALEEQGTLVPLFTGGIIDSEGNVSRDPQLPDLPHFLEVYEMVHGEPLSGVEYDVWLRLQSMASNSRFIALPKDTPDDIVQAYVTAMNEILADPESAQIVAPLFEGYDQVVDAEAPRQILSSMVDMSDEVWDYLSNWLYEREGIRLGE